MVDFGSSSLASPPPSILSTSHFSLNNTQKADHEPLPSIEGCGLNHQHDGKPDAQPPAIPFQRDVGSLFSLDEGFGQGEQLGQTGERLGETHEVGGPRSTS